LTKVRTPSSSSTTRTLEGDDGERVTDDAGVGFGCMVFVNVISDEEIGSDRMGPSVRLQTRIGRR
jgi:hypothetical protein